MLNFIWKSVLIFLLTALSVPLFAFNDIKPGGVWLQMSESQRVIYLIGYVQGVDTGVDVAEDDDGIMYESFFGSNTEFRNVISNRTSKFYKRKENRSVPMLHMVLLAYIELQGESKYVIEMRLQMAKEISEPYLGKKVVKQGDYWLQLSQGDRQLYIDGLIKGIQLGIHLGRQHDSKMINLFENIFNLKEEIWAIAEIATEIVRDEEYKDLYQQYLFPFAFMKYSKRDKLVIEEFYKEIIERMRKDIEAT